MRTLFTKIRWLDHILRKGPLGRPRLRWREQVEKDLNKIGGHQLQAQIRRVWKATVNEAKNRLRFQQLWIESQGKYLKRTEHCSVKTSFCRCE